MAQFPPATARFTASRNLLISQGQRSLEKCGGVPNLVASVAWNSGHICFVVMM